MRLGRASFRMHPPQTFPLNFLRKRVRRHFGAVFSRFCVRWHLPSERKNGPRCHVAVHLALAFLRRGNCGNRECWPFPVFRCPAFPYIRRIAPPFATGEGRKRGLDKRESFGRERGRFGGGEAPFWRKGPLPLQTFPRKIPQQQDPPAACAWCAARRGANLPPGNRWRGCIQALSLRGCGIARVWARDRNA